MQLFLKAKTTQIRLLKATPSGVLGFSKEGDYTGPLDNTFQGLANHSVMYYFFSNT